jgi:transcriptional regulator with PAS, ATPase and Fis domain
MRELSIYDFVEHANTNLNALAKVLGISRQRLEYWAKNDGVLA